MLELAYKSVASSHRVYTSNSIACTSDQPSRLEKHQQQKMACLLAALFLAVFVTASSSIPIMKDTSDASLIATLQETLEALKAQQAPTQPPHGGDDEAMVVVPRMPLFILPPQEAVDALHEHDHDHAMAQAKQQLSNAFMQAMKGGDEPAKVQELKTKIALAIVGGIASAVAGSVTDAILSPEK